MSYKHLKEIETLDKKNIYYFTKNDDHKFINTVSEINSRLKYKPAIKDGKAVAVKDVTHKCSTEECSTALEYRAM